jgi:host factor-I protein
MQSFLERRPATLDTSQPSVRLVQDLIRRRQPVTMLIAGGSEVEGVIRWQDVFCFGLHQSEDLEDGRPLTLINREHVAMIRTLG